MPQWPEGEAWLTASVGKVAESDTRTLRDETIVDGRRVILQSLGAVDGAVLTLTVESAAGAANVAEAPTNPATPTAIPNQAPNSSETFNLNGHGQTVTDQITISRDASAHFRHNGQSNFMVKAFIGDKQELLVNEIGVYEGLVL